ncbi:MAG: hypothetical protein P4L84_36850, partial [Isosphaeraceae bacterium]|nr:hypothetical protein [Isosphaeraceae bacterium]
ASGALPAVKLPSVTPASPAPAGTIVTIPTDTTTTAGGLAGLTPGIGELQAPNLAALRAARARQFLKKSSTG